MAPAESRAGHAEDPLTDALDELGKGSGFLWMIFLFTMLPPIFAGMHSNSYIYIAQVPTHWCAVAELSAANWTSEQIRNVSSAGPCARYEFNYTWLAEIGFEESAKYAGDRHEGAKTVGCSRYNYADDVEIESMVEEWDLVCSRSTERATTHMALSLGKLVGAGLLGAAADKYGRHAIYSLGIVMFIVAGPASAAVPWYWGFVFLRLLTGISFSAIQFSALTTLTEVAGNTHRQWMGIAFNCGFASGSIFVAGIAYLSSSWRQLQAATSLPGLLLLLFMWFMPESPRWLIARGRREEARKILEKFHGPIKDEANSYESQASAARMIAGEKSHKPSLLSDQMRGLKVIFSHGELRTRASITCFAWMTASLTYYVLALNVDNISANYYAYSVLLGVTEIPAYLVPSLVLALMGRRQASSVFFVASGLLLLAILGITSTDTTAIVAASLFSRFLLSVAYGIIILYTSEFFPTVTRNSALGLSSALAHVGSIVAPYSVDELGKLRWWGPSTMCGSLAVLAGFLCLALPETRGRTLADSVEQELKPGRGRVSFRCC